jgi:hypothetical protein
LYEVTKPKFCSSCGESLDGLSKASKKQEPELEPELDVDLNKLKRSIVVEGNSDKTSLKDIWSSAGSQSSNLPPMQRPPSNDPEGQALLDQTVKECSSSRMRDVDE